MCGCTVCLSVSALHIWIDTPFATLALSLLNLLTTAPPPPNPHRSYGVLGGGARFMSVVGTMMQNTVDPGAAAAAGPGRGEVSNVGQAFLEGGKTFGKSLLKGVTGIVTNPLEVGQGRGMGEKAGGWVAGGVWVLAWARVQERAGEGGACWVEHRIYGRGEQGVVWGAQGLLLQWLRESTWSHFNQSSARPHPLFPYWPARCVPLSPL
jgi:hypothetical protein